ncbi:MAG: ABC transporter ATP-binding protein [Gemmatimonadales bacterium]
MGPVGRADRPELAVRGRALELRYGRRTALLALDLDVAAGEVVGVLGPNGAGKTSLLRLLATGRRPAAGTLALLGEDASHPTAALRRKIGVAGDEAVHLDALSGRENLALFARAAGLSRAAAARAADPMLDRFHLTADADRPVAEYSLGMRRRLLLAEALAHEPRLVVLDEPTTGLDPEGRDALRAVLRERAAAGAAVVCASNDVAEVERLADRVIFLRDGRKVLEGGPRDLIAALGDKPVVEMRRPDLSDVFRRATGEELAQ